jgi:hypothetical protein
MDFAALYPSCELCPLVTDPLYSKASTPVRLEELGRGIILNGGMYVVARS